MTVEDLQSPTPGQTVDTNGSKGVLDNKSEPSKHDEAITEKENDDEEEDEQEGVVDEANIGLKNIV